MLRLVILAFLLTSGIASASQQDDLDKLRKRIASLQKDFEKANESRAEIADNLRESERAISDSNRTLEQLNQQRGSANQELHALQVRAEELKKQMQSQQSQLGKLIYQQYVDNSAQDSLKLLLNNSDPNQAARDFKYYEYIARDRASTLKSLRVSLNQLQTITVQAHEKRDEIAALQIEERKGLQQLERDKSLRQQTLLKIASQLKQQRREIGRLRHNEAQLSQLIEKLAHVMPDVTGSDFQKLKGKLPMPVKGKLTNQFGTHRPDSSLAWTGWFISSPPNQVVKAIAAGNVVYADWLRGFGNLLIIDHGQGYMSLYGNNQTLFKQAGDALHAGDTIAAVGNSGGNEDSGLYFELRFEGKPFDPTKWFRR